MAVLRSVVAVGMILFGFVSFPYPREDWGKTGLMLGCACLEAGGVVGLVLLSWWPVLAGLILGFGLPMVVRSRVICARCGRPVDATQAVAVERQYYCSECSG